MDLPAGAGDPSRATGWLRWNRPSFAAPVRAAHDTPGGEFQAWQHPVDAGTPRREDQARPEAIYEEPAAVSTTGMIWRRWRASSAGDDSASIMDDRAAKMDPSGLIGTVCLDLDFQSAFSRRDVREDKIEPPC